MYLNVISFKNGKTLAFQTETPYNADLVNEGSNPEFKYGDWNLITDASNGQILSFRGTEIVTIATAPVSDQARRDNRSGKGLTTTVTTE